jgi:hypothetical protein
MAKFEYTEEIITQLCEEFEFPRRSVTAKLRKQGFDVPHKPKAAPTFTEQETTELRTFLTANEGVFTAEEIAEQVAEGKFTARQINGKALSLELTGAIKPADKKVVARTYSESEEEQIAEMVASGDFIEDIAEALGKEVEIGRAHV